VVMMMILITAAATPYNLVERRVSQFNLAREFAVNTFLRSP
jgi:hypothetical protein